jgi:dihydropteroate synthase
MGAPCRRRYTLQTAGGVLRLGERTLVMAVLNVTPDSFSDGGLHADPAEATDAALRFAAEGADIIDVGGESTRPGAEGVDTSEEKRRVLPVVRAVARQTGVPVSIDTRKADVAAAALDAGAAMVNDVSGLHHDRRLAAVAAARRAALVLMHMRGSPADMYRLAEYRDAVGEVAAELQSSVDAAVDLGVARESIVVDPGVGFAKRADHSLQVLARLDDPRFLALDRPLLVGPSRKSFLTAAAGTLPPAERDWATAAAVAVAIVAGAHIVRVHRVAEMIQVVRVADALARERCQGEAG